MSRFGRSFNGTLTSLVVCLTAWIGSGGPASAAEVLLKDGRILQGKLGVVASLADVPQAPEPDGTGPLRLILLLDDDLRRTFVSKRQVREVRQEDPGQLEEKFTIRQRVLRAGRSVNSVGPVIQIQPFDSFGRRIFRMNTPKGPVDIIQGITLITPRWTKVEGISHVWDMRMATSSVPRDVLHKILIRQIDPKDLEHRKKIARFCLQSERYTEARGELEAIVKAFPDNPDIAKEMAPTIRALRQLSAQRLLSEMKLRRGAGQHRMVLAKLEKFPSEGVAGEILQAVREMVEEYKTYQRRGKEVFEQFNALLEKITDTATRDSIRPIRAEIVAELNINTLGRMAAFRQNVGDPKLLPEEKLSLAVSGWLLGSDAATVKLPVALSLWKVRELVRQYINEPIKLTRAKIFGLFQTEEGATPTLVAGLLAHMKPPLELPPPVSETTPGFYKLEVAGLAKEPPVEYLVQVPPEYDPYRRYPTIITLHGAGTSASHQIDWWAGGWTKGGWRTGQATRHGYIVIAPKWTAEHQKKYGYSAREHAAVLNSLRDACRRFAVDTDRVYLTGHSIGGDAAWDLGLAHPDLWAGVIPIVGRSDRYCSLYWENARYVPFYYVCGEMDAAQLTKNSRDLDRYLKRGYNATVAEYRGRGHEHFYDEILRLFDWMGRLRREFFPREFNCATMRQWDNYFWWVELEGLPTRSMVAPSDWPPPRGTRPVTVKASITANNGINVRVGTSRVTVWVSPQMIDFKRRANIVVNGRRMNSFSPFVEPDLLTLLEDVRTRGDRQHPFWARFETPTGRGG